MAGAPDGAHLPSDDDEVDDPWGVASVVHLRAGGTSLLLDAAGTGLPGVLHWGGDLGELSVDEVDALAAALAPARRAGGRPGARRAPAAVPLGTPLLAPGRFGTPGPDLVAVTAVPGAPTTTSPAPTATVRGDGRDGDVAAADVPGDAPPRAVPASRPPARPAPPATLRRTRLTLGVTRGDHQRLTARAADPACGLEVEVVLDLSPTGVLRLRALAATAADAPVLVGGLHLALPVPPAGEQELLDVGGRLRHASTRRTPPLPPPDGVVRPSEMLGAVVLATARREPEELWALTASTASRRSSARRADDPLVRAVALPGGAHLLVGGEDVPPPDGAATWTTPVLLAAHGPSWEDVRARLSRASREDG